MNVFNSNIDLIIFVMSCIILLIYLIKFFQNGSNSSGDDEGGNDGGQLNPANDPVLDLPPGVTLPIDVTEPEAV
jgi:hypothetical protein